MTFLKYYAPLFLLTSFFSHSALAEYNTSYWQDFVIDMDSSDYSQANYLYAIEPSVDNCAAGAVTDIAKLRAFETLNELRNLHLLPPVEYSYYYDNQIQQSALLQKANNFLDHSPSGVAECYTSDAYYGSRSSALLSGVERADPADNIVTWLDDASDSIMGDVVGNRRWLLNPFLDYMTYAQVDGFAALKVSRFYEEPETDTPVEVDYVAFPYQKYPYVFLSDKTTGQRTPWSFTVIEDKNEAWNNWYNYFVNATLTVSNKETGENLLITHQHADEFGYGVPNVLTWTAQNWQYDTWYRVEISGVSMRNGTIQSYGYDVFIDHADLINLSSPLEQGDTLNNTAISGELNTQKDKDTFKLRLYGLTHFMAANPDYMDLGYFINLYNSAKQLVYSSDTSFEVFLVDDTYTVEIASCNPSMSCYAAESRYTLDITPPLPSEKQVLTEEFIKRLYLNILGRTADHSGVEFWYDIIQHESASSVIFGFLKSMEFIELNLNDDGYVDVLYRTLLGREADAGGKSNWVAALQSGELRETVLYGFLMSAEFADLVGRFSGTVLSEEEYAFYQIKQFVVRFYQRVLGRHADIGGYEGWSNTLQSGASKASDIARGFFFSAEFISHGHDNSRFVDIAYQAILNRQAMPVEINHWVIEIENGIRTREQVIEGFIGSAEFKNLADSYGIIAN